MSAEPKSVGSSPLWEVFMGNATPDGLATGIALGIVLGVLPKDNLLAVACAVLLFASRLNLAAGLVTTGLCSLVATRFDGLFHRVGDFILDLGPLQGLYANLFALPLVPWTSLRNTV
ncbi:MAG TPA: hypothetical protein VIY86_03315, partial [Pirellulaceae bacterium]